jgi:hypothetical protein
VPPNFYNAGDQAIYAAGDFFIPQERYRAAPYTVNQPTNPDEVPAGIPAVYQAQGSGAFNPYNTDMSNVRQDYNAFPSRQAGEIYSKTFNPGPNPYATSMYGGSLPRAQSQYNLANQNISLTGPMTPERRAEIMRTTDDIIQDNRMKYATEGQYIDQYDPNYSSMTEAQKFMDNYPDYYGVPSGVPEPGIPGAIKSYMQNSLLGKGFGIAKDFLDNVLPINERAIMENEARGAGIFTDDIGRIVTDDYNTAGGIMAGYNLNQIDEGSFDKRRDTIKNTLGSKYGLTAGQIEAAKNDPNYTGPGKNLIDRLGLLDESEEDILGARKKTKQIYKMIADKKAADKKIKEAEKAAEEEEKRKAAEQKAFQERVAREADTAARARSRNQAVYESADRQGFTNRDGGFSTSRADRAGTSVGSGQFSPSSSRGRSGYMLGGLADMLEIYD